MRTWIAILLLGVVAQAQNVLRVSVEEVQVYATVTDLKGRFVTNLKSPDFRLFEDGVEQQVNSFSADDTPLSIAIIADVKLPVGVRPGGIRDAATAFLKVGNVRNEYFLMEIGEKPEIRQDFTPDVGRLVDRVSVADRVRSDATGDAINTALDKLRTASNPRKVLLLLTSGIDSQTLTRASALRDLARQLNVQIYAVVISTSEVYGTRDGANRTASIIQSLGGEAFIPDATSAEDVLNACRKISVGLRNQYLFSYRSTNGSQDGLFRKLQVRLSDASGPTLFVHTREGYYSR